MRIGQISSIASAILLASAVPAHATPKVRRGPTAPHLFKQRTPPPPKTKLSTLHIAPERATQIQGALIKAGYLTGTPSGAWDAQTQAAMEKLQGDNGWQTKLVPDSRAIIKLGLGSDSNPIAATTPSDATETVSPDATPVPTPTNK